MIEQGIYDANEIHSELGYKFSQVYRNIVIIQKKNINNIKKVQEEMENYIYSLRKIVEIFESYINENLQVKIKIRKFIVEDL